MPEHDGRVGNREQRETGNPKNLTRRWLLGISNTPATLSIIAAAGLCSYGLYEAQQYGDRESKAIAGLGVIPIAAALYALKWISKAYKEDIEAQIHREDSAPLLGKRRVIFNRLPSQRDLRAIHDRLEEVRNLEKSGK